MSVIGSNVLAGASGQSAGGGAAYQIDRSVRLNSADTAYFSRTPSSASNRKTWTWSGWVKRSSLGSRQQIFGAVASGAIFGSLEFSNLDELRFFDNALGSGNIVFTTNRIFRDISAWYHIVLALDSTQATASDRVKLYVNGAQETSFSAGPSVVANGDGLTNSTAVHNIGSWLPAVGGLNLNAYLAETHFVDGQQLAASDFGEFDDNNVWQPIEYAGTYGTNGFYLDFSDNSSASALGTDAAGSNDWTVNNLTVVVRSVVGATVPYSGRGTSDAYILFDSTVAPLSGSTFPIDSSYLGHAQISNPFDSQVITFSPAITSSGNVYLYACKQTSGGNIKVNVGYPSETTISIGGSWDYYDTGLSTIYNIQFLAATSSSNILSGLQFISTTSDASGRVSSSQPQHQDSLIDTPTNYEAASGNNGGNYATLNPLAPADGTISQGNLQIVTNSSGYGVYTSNFGMLSGKWYAEAVATAMPEYTHFGLIKSTVDYSSSTIVGNAADTAAYRSNDGVFRLGGSDKFTGATFAANDVIGLAFDADAGSCAVYKNGSLQGTATGFSSGTWFFAGSDNGNGTATHVWNFGQRPFAYTAPTGYKSLCTTNLPDPTIADGSTAMDVITYSGNGTSLTVPNASSTPTSLKFDPGFVWIKQRATPKRDHNVYDIVRGATKLLSTNGTSSASTTYDVYPGDGTEQTVSGLTQFNTNSKTFDVGSSNVANSNAVSYVAWTWDGGANSSKTYTVKVVSDGGNKFRFDDFGTSAVTLDLEEGSTYVFDQSDSSNATHPLRFATAADAAGGTEYTTGVTTTGTPGQAGAKTTITVASGAPTLYYYCSSHTGMGGQANTNSTAGASNFAGSIQSTVRANASTGFSIVSYTGNGSTSPYPTIGHGLNAVPKLIITKSRDSSANWTTYTTVIDGTLDFLYLNTTGAAGSSSLPTPPDSSIFQVGGSTNNANGDNCIAYCFAPVEGYSAFGSYEGTGSPVFVYLGFRPAFVLYKNADAAAGWQIYDSTRDSFNQCDARLQTNGSGAEDTEAAIDILSNGFNQRASHLRSNASGNTYVYAAFAEHPLKHARAR